MVQAWIDVGDGLCSLIQFVLCVHNNCSFILHVQCMYSRDEKGLKMGLFNISVVTLKEL